MKTKDLLNEENFGLESSYIIEGDYEFDFYGFITNHIISFSYDYEDDDNCIEAHYVYHLKKKSLIKTDVKYFIKDNGSWVEKEMDKNYLRVIDKFIKDKSNEYMDEIIDNVDSKNNRETFNFYKSLNMICESSQT